VTMPVIIELNVSILFSFNARAICQMIISNNTLFNIHTFSFSSSCSTC